MSSTQSRESVLFARVLEKPAAERAAFLRKLAGDDPALVQRLEALVAAHEASAATATSENAAPAARATIALEFPDSEDEILGTRISHYKVLQRLGEGGCGVVYMAEQQVPVRRTVALKVIKLGMDTREVVARFEAERQALALMNHPNIAKVLDAGATESGRPFFVMEHVQGVPITHYCDLHQLSTVQRLELFTQVCQAIQHAHQKGIIHRDIKPSNILVTLQDEVPVPKVIDFGIAKAIGRQRLTEKTMFTALGQFMGTPDYMSPEQAEMSALDIDTRADIYALGVLLYQLLTGRTPFDTEQFLRLGLDEMRRIIRETEPIRPSTRIGALAADEQTKVAKSRQAELPKLIHRVRGDLDWITMKCLEKDRTRRYSTANDLAADVQRHLANEPVVARPPSAGYRLQKTVRRHRLAFAAAAAVLASLILGLGTATRLFFKEQAARREVAAAASEIDRQKSEAERKNVEYRAMLVEAARLDCAVAREKILDGQESDAFAHLARACAFDPESTLAAQMAVASLGTWNQVFPVAVLAGHEDSVSSARFSPDGRHIVTASGDKAARIWDASTGKTLLSLTGHGAAVVSAQYSPDGTRVLTVSMDRTARVWDASSGRVLAVLVGHEDGLSSAQFSPDGRRIVTASTDKTARVWDAVTGRSVATLVGHARPVRSARFSPDGRRVVTASEDTTARVWDATSGLSLVTFSGHEDLVLTAEFSSDGTRVVTASVDGKARIWDAGTGRPVAKPIGHSDAVLTAQFSPDGTRIVTTSVGRSARIWDAASGSLVAHLVGRGEVADAHFSPDGARLVMASSDRTARVFEIATGHILATLAGHEAPVVGAQFSPDGTRVVTASRDKTARVWLPMSNRSSDLLVGHEDWVVSGQFSPDDARVLTVSLDKTVRMWDAATGKPLSMVGGRMGVWDAQFSPDGGRIVTASDHTNAYIWILATGEKAGILSGHEGELRSAQFSPDGTRVVTASVDRTARIWDAATGRTLVTLLGHENRVLWAQFSPDGKRIVTASHDQTARVWDAVTGQSLLTLAGHKDMVRTAGFSPDGRRIVTASLDRTARVWAADTGQLLTTLKGHVDQVWSAAFSPDGLSIVTASGDETAKVWDPVSGKALATLVGHDDAVRSAQFSHDGRRIVTTSKDGTARLWTVLPASAGPVPEWFGDFLRYMGQMRLNSEGELEMLSVTDRRAMRERLRRVLANRVGPNSPYVQILGRHLGEQHDR